jgi:hypothetical protein
LVSPVAFRYRNKDPAPFRHPVNVKIEDFIKIVFSKKKGFFVVLASGRFFGFRPIFWLQADFVHE